MTSHNKKRNVGLVYEMLLGYITENIINDKKGLARKAVSIIERRYNKKTELYKEFRLINALANATVSGTHIAAGILTESKNASRRFNTKQLKIEKSLLIKDINYQLKDKNFFNRNISNYKTYATIQTLINEWQKIDTSDLGKVINYEKIITEHLISEKNNHGAIDHPDAASDRLVFTLLSKKINEKYNKKLSSEQKDIIRNYAIYSDDSNTLGIYLENLKIKTLNILKEFKIKTKNKVLLSKIDIVENKIKNIQTETNSDDNIIKFLTLSSLKEEIIRSEK
jgi:hypothetical protein